MTPRRARVRTSKSAYRQQLVNGVFARCMAEDVRTLDRIREEVRAKVRREAMATGALVFGEDRVWDPTDHQLQIMISRNAMGEGEWDYFPAYSTPPRYVSRRRVLELAERQGRGTLDAAALRELERQLEDLCEGLRHWRRKHRRAREKEGELTALVNNVTNRAFGEEGTPLFVRRATSHKEE